MTVPVVPAIIIIYVLTVGMVFFSFFTAKIAQMKLRSGAWGILGGLLGPVGLLLVCYLPSRRKDGKETNPIRSGVRALPTVSRKAFALLGVLLVVVLVVVQLITFIPKWQENRNYEQSVGSDVTDNLIYSSVVKGKPLSVLTGKDSTYLITQDGALYGWGYNYLNLGQQDKGELAKDVLSVAQMDRTVYLLKKDNKLYSINEEGAQHEVATGVTKVVCGADYGAYINRSGDVYVWGKNAFGQMGNAAGEGSNEPVWLVGGARDIACGPRHLLILKTNGAVVACGSNATGALGQPLETGVLHLVQIASDCKGIAAGSDFSMILTNTGVLKSCGNNDCGQLGREVEEENHLTFEEVATGVEAMGAAGKSGWYISEQTLYTWGQNHCGQLGLGSTENVSLPTMAMEKVTAVSVSGDHMAILSEDRLYVCGDNTYGQLGSLGATHLSPHAVVSVKG